jgi:putative endonuclease
MDILPFERKIYTRLRAFADRKSPLPPHLITGQRGEDAAYFHLRSLGYTIVARRWRSSRLAGDLDLVAWDGDTLVFFEVKARTVRDLIAAQVQVDDYKQIMLRKMASSTSTRSPIPGAPVSRFVSTSSPSISSPPEPSSSTCAMPSRARRLRAAASSAPYIQYVFLGV